MLSPTTLLLIFCWYARNLCVYVSLKTHPHSKDETYVLVKAKNANTKSNGHSLVGAKKAFLTSTTECAIIGA
jgi:hypothetical protein